MITLRFAAALLLILFTVSQALGESPYTRGKASRDGIGKFYMDREIAQVMGHLGAGWLERPQREREERTDLLLQALGLSAGDVVADIGAGTGYFSVPMARQVGPDGRVLAVDIQAEMLALIERRTAAENIDNIRTVLADVDNPRLPRGEVDLVLMVDAYHEFSHPREVMLGIVDALAPGGRVVLVEYRGEDRRVPIKPLHKMTIEQASREMAAVGLRLAQVDDALPWQHLMVFQRAGDE